MGICYNLILIDEMDWGYANTNKEQRIKDFQEEWKKDGGYCCDLIGQWYSVLVFDVDKSFPLTENRKAIIEKYCDVSYYQSDIEFCSLERLT